MIPDLDDDGYLPHGIYRATLDEIRATFGVLSETRRMQFESLLSLVDAAACTDVRRIILGGNFVTDVAEPDDIHCLLLVGGTFQMEGAAEQRLLCGVPGLSMKYAPAKDFQQVVGFRASDREHVVKGAVELIR